MMPPERQKQIAEADVPAELQYTPELIHAVGVLFLTTAMAETGMSFALWRLAAHPHPFQASGLLPLWGMEAKVKLEKIRAIGHLHLSKDGAKELGGLCDKLRRLFTRRNEIAHYMNWPTNWAKPDNKVTLETIRIAADGGVEMGKTFNAKQIRQFAAAVVCRIKELDALMGKHGIAPLPKQIGQVPPPPERHQPRIGMTIGKAQPTPPEPQEA